MITSLILAVSPFIVTGLTSLTKRIPIINGLSDGARVAAIRLVAAVFSVASASIIFALGGDPVAHASVEEVVLALLTFMSATGGHELLKQKD